MAKRETALLADEPGLGKTIQAIRAADEAGSRRVLVICPASVVENWRREIAKWRRGEWDATVTSYDMAVRQRPTGHDTLILDEAHYLKNRKAKRTQTVFGPRCNGEEGIISEAKRTWFLTGTPAPNDYSELYPMLRMMRPSPLYVNGRLLDYWSFIKRYCITEDKGFGTRIIGSKNGTELRERMAPVTLRRLKSDVLKDLPEITYSQFPMTNESAMRALGKPPFSGDVALIAEALESGDLEDLAPSMAQLRRFVGKAKAKQVVDFVCDLMFGGVDKIVVFYIHRDVGAELAKGLRFFNPAQIDGSVSQRDRVAAVDKFQKDPTCKVFLGQIIAAGTGITLTAASTLIFAEMSWVPGENAQAAMRIHRIGQRNACNVYFATLADSIDEKVTATIARKVSAINKLLG